MSYLKIATCIFVLAFMAWIPLPKTAAADQPARSMSPGLEEPNKGPTNALGMPVYKPPKRGAPGGRVGGGTRGSGDDIPALSVLAPDHVGFTTQEQPTLYWYISKATSYPIELAIIHSQGTQQLKPLIETRLPSPAQAGVQRIRLADYGVRLAPGSQYQWFIAVMTKPDRRSKDVIAGGFIERIGPPEAIQTKLDQAGKTSAAHVYAETGIWYDAVTALSDMIEAAPNSGVLRKQRAALLQQVGLPEVAEHDLKYPTAN